MPGNPRAFLDVTTAYVSHLVVLRNANAGADLTTLVAKDLVTMRNAVSAGNQDDLNTAIPEYLLLND